MIHPERRRENLKKIEEMDKRDAWIKRLTWLKLSGARIAYITIPHRTVTGITATRFIGQEDLIGSALTEKGKTMTKDEIIDGLRHTEELLKTELPVLLAWDAIKAVNEAITFIRRNDELRYQVCR